MKTLNQLLNLIERLARSHKQINFFFYGDIVQCLSNGEVTYPACFCDVNNATIDIGNNQTIYKIELWFCDIVNVSDNSRGNETEVQSDITRVAEDMVAMIKSTTFQDEITVNDTFQLEYFSEKFEDMTMAVKTTIEVGLLNLADRCQVPSEGIDWEPDGGQSNPVAGKDPSIYKYPYTGTGTEGDTLTVSILEDKEILLLFKGDKLITPVDSDPTPNEYVKAGSVFTFGNDIENEQLLQFIYKSI